MCILWCTYVYTNELALDLLVDDIKNMVKLSSELHHRQDQLMTAATAGRSVLVLNSAGS